LLGVLAECFGGPGCEERAERDVHSSARLVPWLVFGVFARPCGGAPLVALVAVVPDLGHQGYHHRFSDRQRPDLTDPNSHSSQTFTIDVHVQINNSNFVDALMSEAHFTAEYDSHVVAAVVVETFAVPHRSEVIVVAHARTTITPELSNIWFAAVIPSFHLRVKVVGTAHVKVTSFFGLKVQAKLTCWVDVNVWALAQDPNEMVVGHECTYNIGF